MLLKLNKESNLDLNESFKDVVIRKPLIVSGQGGAVNLVSIDDDTKNFQNDNNNYSDTNALFNEIRSINSNLINIKRRIEEVYESLKNENSTLSSQVDDKFSLLNSSIKRIAVQPVVRTANSIIHK